MLNSGKPFYPCSTFFVHKKRHLTCHIILLGLSPSMLLKLGKTKTQKRLFLLVQDALGKLLKQQEEIKSWLYSKTRNGRAFKLLLVRLTKTSSGFNCDCTMTKIEKLQLQFPNRTYSVWANMQKWKLSKQFYLMLLFRLMISILLSSCRHNVWYDMHLCCYRSTSKLIFLEFKYCNTLSQGRVRPP